jgi:lipid II isoglutaminyl synthase (glutamine-hydrolysing)
VRVRLAVLTTRAVNATSRRLGRGQGTVAGGRSGLKVDPQLLQHLTASRQVALVSGTNGKTTTTRLLAVALGADGSKVVSNETGSNMPPGHVAALAGDRRAGRAVLEVDEIYLPRVLAATKPAAVVLLNLSRDQLDRTNEVRMVSGHWRAALAAAPHATVVANADDPLVVWAAGAAAQVRWVGAGLRWQLDAVGCPSCEGRIAFDADGSWACVTGCGFVRPVPMAKLTTGEDGAHGHSTTYQGEWADGRSEGIRLLLPGRFNHSNALMAAVAAEAMGIAAADGLAAMAGVDEVAGRFTTRLVNGVRTRLMLAKNPAGWSELLELVGKDDGPIVISINARTADGADPSWLWDVPFERLAPRVVVATGDRCRDLSVRLHYAGVAHVVEPDPLAAVRRAHADAGGAADDGDGDGHAHSGGDADGHVHSAGDDRVDVIGNYTAFDELLGASVTPRPEQ